MWLFVLFLGIPLMEIALFVTVGGWIGLWATLAIILGTGFLGVAIIRATGLRAIADLQRSVQAIREPKSPIARQALTMIAGMLLILPGFLTDTLGLLVLLPPLQHLLIRFAASRIVVARAGFASQAHRRHDVLDAEYFEVGPEQDHPPQDRPDNRVPPSGWTRH